MLRPSREIFSTCFLPDLKLAPGNGASERRGPCEADPREPGASGNGVAGGSAGVLGGGAGGRECSGGSVCSGADGSWRRGADGGCCIGIRTGCSKGRGAGILGCCRGDEGMERRAGPSPGGLSGRV